MKPFVHAGLFVFAVLFNWAISRVARVGITGYTALMVVFGVGVVLIGAWLVYGIDIAVGMFGLFAAAGLPMVLGAMWRWLHGIK